MGAAKKLEFYGKGVARVRVETIQVKEESALRNANELSANRQ
jgi:rare lipoprotein A (peptidoglycan hydrolase)